MREHQPSDLRVAGITPFTTIDFPGKLSAVVFIQGCPWRCPYCHNPWMQPREFDPSLEHGSWEEVASLLSRRKGLLDGVIFSGGEPCVDPALPAAIRAVKDMGYAAGLHTGGAYPRVLETILPMLDWVGMDVKADPRDAAHFDRTAGAKGAAEHFLLSHRLLKESGVAHELRTTAHPDWLPDERLLSLADWLKSEVVDTFALQIYRRPPGGLLTGLFPAVGIDYPAPETMTALKGAVTHFVERRNDR